MKKLPSHSIKLTPNKYARTLLIIAVIIASIGIGDLVHAEPVHAAPIGWTTLGTKVIGNEAAALQACFIKIGPNSYVTAQTILPLTSGKYYSIAVYDYKNSNRTALNWSTASPLNSTYPHVSHAVNLGVNNNVSLQVILYNGHGAYVAASSVTNTLHASSLEICPPTLVV